MSWPASSGPLPLGLERTVQAAVRRETRSDAGGPRAVGQWIRRALPVTVSAQGPIGAEGLPAVLISESGERGPAADTSRCSTTRLQRVRARGGARGRRARRRRARATARRSPDAPEGIVTLRNVLPDWAARLVVGSLLLPALLAALDAFFRARRRRVPIGPWIAWLAVAAVPLPVAWLWLRLIGATGAIDVPDGPVLPDRFPLETSGIIALVSAAIAAALACWGARLAARAPGAARVRAPPRSAAASNGAPRRRGRRPASKGSRSRPSSGCAPWRRVTWAAQPVRRRAARPGRPPVAVRRRGDWRAAAPGSLALVAGLAPARRSRSCTSASRSDLGPHELAWGAALGATAGAGLVVDAAARRRCWPRSRASLRVLLARRRIARETGAGAAPIRTRGPVTYAGPGSLGGTESALRR